ncbi:MAG: glycosyltransferase, partial [Kiloniellales bacterium]|nr:glycosyltransferase [Kiloniellales bacterium]
MSKGKLLLVTRDVDGGIGRHFVDLAAGMADRGWKVHCVRAAGVEGHVTDHSARLDALAGVTVHEIPLARSIGLGDLRSYLAFRRIVKQHGPFDIAHGHGAKGGVLARLPCRDIKASVYTPHG